jgi:cyclopropane-fatty-acyl-phospholipid synthase
MGLQLHAQPKTLDNFLDKYIFPGGYLPSINQLVNCLSRGAQKTLELESIENIGENYVKALRVWRERFIENWDTIRTAYTRKYEPETEADIEAFKRRWIVRLPYSAFTICC